MIVALNPLIRQEEQVSQQKIREMEQKIYQLTLELNELRQAHSGEEVTNYEFETLNGAVYLKDLFADQEQLMLIHNMGQACRYCTLWADGINGLLPHLEQVMSVALVSKDSPTVQHQFANERGWRFRLASHGGGAYMNEQSVMGDGSNSPGVVVYQRHGEKIFRRNSAMFGPNDQFCSMWSLLSLAGRGVNDWTPQYSYWKRPEIMEDGGENLN